MIAAMQYAALRLAWPLARAKHDFSEQDEADWAETMELLWVQMTPAEQQAVEDDITRARDPDDGHISPRCPSTVDGHQCEYERTIGEHLHWAITDAGEITWTEESVALRALAAQLQRLADGVDNLAEAAEQGLFIKKARDT